MATGVVIGGSGYTGAELLRCLARHDTIEVVHVTAASNAGQPVSALYPSLGPAYPDTTFAAWDVATVPEGADVAFVALPHGESQAAMEALASRVSHVVDLGADFRLPAGTYREWYGDEHAAPDLLAHFAYGLPELFRDEITAFRHVANPGCYPTAAILALAPALARGLAAPAGIMVDAISGVSGRGRGLSTESLFSEANEAISAYGLLRHRHTAEMEMALGAVAGTPAQVLFTPHLAPLTRGILATCYARPLDPGLTEAALVEAYRDFYAGEPFVVVTDEPVPSKAASGANTVFVTPRYDARTGTILVVAAEDNLVKGAAGQAIQNANLLLDLPETTGLDGVGIMP